MDVFAVVVVLDVDGRLLTLANAHCLVHCWQFESLFTNSSKSCFDSICFWISIPSPNISPVHFAV